MWCLGDLVGYGAEPDACVELARRHAAICLAGNHDLGVRGDAAARAVLPRRRAGGQVDAGRRSPPRRASTSNGLEPQQLDEQVGLYHASPRDPVWEYVLSPLQAELCLDVQRHRVCLIGHSHVALSFSRAPGRSRPPARPATDGEELDLEHGEWLINPGSVGQPRDGDPRAAWLELDLDELRAPSTAAPSTTSRAPRPRSAPPGCRTRWRSGWPTASEARSDGARP